MSGCSSIILVAVTNPSVGEGSFQLTLTLLGFGPSLREIRVVTKTGTEEENMEKYCLLIYSLVHP